MKGLVQVCTVSKQQSRDESPSSPLFQASLFHLWPQFPPLNGDEWSPQGSELFPRLKFPESLSLRRPLSLSFRNGKRRRHPV